MERATVSRIEGWDVRPVSGGYAGLADLADAEFTGAVAGGGAHLFMLNGRVVGVYDGTISAFEGADSTAYEAPDPALPLLFAMKERGGEVKGKYYTDDTPLGEVDGTLSEGGFTGYLELSENVLSGDYYVVYYGGRSLSAAFVGNEERVVTGEEAFELAADEVGIYEVRAVELEVTDVPEPPDESDTGAAGAAGAAGATGAVGSADGAGADDEPAADAEGEVEAVPEDEPEADDEALDGEAEAETEAGAETDEPEGVPDEPAGDDAGTGEETTEADETGDEEATTDVSPGGEAADAAEDAAVDESGTGAEIERPGGGADDASVPESTPGAGSAEPRPEEPPERSASAGSGRQPGVERRRQADEPDERFREEERWREARTVPALDPEESEIPTAKERIERTEPHEPTQPDSTTRPDAGEPEPDASSERVSELEAELEATEEERRRLAKRVEAVAEERDELADERAALAERVEELEALIEDQEARLEAQEAEIAAEAAASSSSGSHERASGEAIDPETALDQTDLFVRYRSKGRATLQTAHDGQAGMEEVAENLRLETHSRFDPAGVTVDGRPFEAYLSDTIEYRFVAWLIEELLYEIRGTGTERSLRAVYDALPQIDRAEFDGTVTGVDEEGNEREETFDVVCRDRMGKPLVLANINDSLDPASGEMMGALVEDATAAAEAHESIGAAFLVTASFFEPDALETAADATGGGFLSRDSKKSFVKLSRKGGYHLCLAEARGGDFHVAVPEL